MEIPRLYYTIISRCIGMYTTQLILVHHTQLHVSQRRSLVRSGWNPETVEPGKE